MNNKRPPAKKISRDAVVKDCDAILRMSVIFAVLGAALYWGLLDTLAPSFAQAIDGSEIGGFLMAFGLLGAVAAAHAQTKLPQVKFRERTLANGLRVPT